MATPDSSATAYAASTDLIARFDVRTVRELASDVDAPIDAADLATNDRVLACLKDASGMVEAACTVGERYTPDDLGTLTGVSLQLLKRLVCDLTIGLLFLARPDRKGEPPKVYLTALETLDDLSSGAKIFGFIEARQAGAPVRVDVETAADVERRNDLTIVAQRFFGRRVDRLNG